ncbi:MAG TPA: 50S ribosomal protein L18 [Fimbriiglobus sp.]|jgi:large subunit ribosomal protein L18
MDAQKLKHRQAERRQFRVRKSIRGTAAKPRLSVFRSSKHIYAQLIDDENQVTLAAVGSKAKGKASVYGGNAKAAAAVGTALAEKAKTLGIAAAAFDRGHYRFHGRVKALARAATQAGLICTGLKEEEPKKAAPVAEKAPKKEKGEGKKEKGEAKKPEPAKA